MIDSAIRALLLFTLLTGQITNQKIMVQGIAEAFGVDPVIALLVVEYESSWNPEAVGDSGAAVGLYQWHLPSWELVRKHMGASLEDLRSSPVESTITTMYAWKRMGLQHWWTTYERAKEEAAK